MQVNSRVARAEAAALLMQAHDDLGGGVLTPSRTLQLTLDVTLGTIGKPHRLYLFNDAALLATPRRSSTTTVGKMARLLSAPRRARFAARRWIPLAGLTAHAEGATLTLTERTEPGAPLPEPPLVLGCDTSAAAAEAADAVAAAQQLLTDLIGNGYKRAGGAS